MFPFIYSQATAFLLSQPVDISVVKAALSGFHLVKEEPAYEHWAMNGPSISVSAGSEKQFQVDVDVCPQPWPDEMEPGLAEPHVTVAWSTGCFGPYASPGGLKRAWVYNLLETEALAPAQNATAFIRVRVRILESERKAEDRSSQTLLRQQAGAMLEVSAAIASIPEALAYFNSAGDLLLTPSRFLQIYNNQKKDEVNLLALLVSNRIANTGDGKFLCDTIGLKQLGMTDHECVLAQDAAPIESLRFHFLNVASYQISSGNEIKPGHTIDGPDGKPWSYEVREKSLYAPEREVWHWEPAQPKSQVDQEEEDEDGRIIEERFHPVVDSESVRDLFERYSKTKDFKENTCLEFFDEPTVRGLFWYHFLKLKWATAISLPRKLRGMNLVLTEKVKAQLEKLTAKGRLIWTLVIRANSVLYDDTEDKGAPGFVMGSFEKETPKLISIMAGLIERIGEVHSGGKDPTMSQWFLKNCVDDQFVFGHRILIPAEFTEGHEIYMFHLMIERDTLPGGKIEQPFIPCLATPGEDGVIRIVPDIARMVEKTAEAGQPKTRPPGNRPPPMPAKPPTPPPMPGKRN